MSFIGNMFSGNKGNGWQASGTNILNPSTTGQADQTYGQSQTGLAQQQAFLQALQGQNGIQNQSNVFNQLQGVANGTGPNPAQAMLNQSTGANVANQAALMAGQRGAGSNVGLMARQAGQQGAQTQQQAAGQGATMQANQSLNAMNQLSGIAGQQVQNQGNAANAYTNAAQAANANVLNGIGQQNQANIGMQSNINNANAGIANTNAEAQNKATAGLLANIPMVGQAFKGAEGGPVPPASSLSRPTFPNHIEFNHFLKMAEGGVAAPSAIDIGTPMAGKKYDFYKGAAPSKEEALKGGGGGGGIAAAAPMAGLMAEGGPVPALLSPGEKYLSPNEAAMMKEGKASLNQVGKKIPGKAKVKGNSYANDTVPATLEEGGMVIPRSVMESKNPEWAAHKFVRAHMSSSLKRQK